MFSRVSVFLVGVALILAVIFISVKSVNNNNEVKVWADEGQAFLLKK